MDTILQWVHQGTSTAIAFVVLLGLLIFVHELGHFSVAKFFGIRVEVFSLGFGRKILQRKWGDTTYCVSIIPFGGYVKMFGDDPSAEVPAEEKHHSFLHQPVLPRIAVVLAGPFMNAVFAAVVFAVIAIVGEEVLKPQVGDVFEGTAAYQAGFRSEDQIKSISGMPTVTWDDVKKEIENNPEHPLTFVVQRQGQTVTVTATPDAEPNKNVLSSRKIAGNIDGLSYLKEAAVVGISDPASPAARAGLKTGDVIRKINGEEILTWEALVAKIQEAAAASEAQPLNLDVQRGDDDKNLLQIKLPLSKANPMAGIEPSELYLSSVVAKTPAADAGLKPGDKVAAINGKGLNHWGELVKAVQSYKDGESPLSVEVVRDGKQLTFSIAPKFVTQTDTQGMEVKSYALGVVTSLAYSAPNTFILKQHGPKAVISKGVSDAVRWTSLTVISFVKLLKHEVSAKSIGGPLMILKLAGDTWRIGLASFLRVMGILSINLFVLNLLPIPVLDGGHLLFFTIEAVKGSPLSLRKMEMMQRAGMLLLLVLMVLSVFNDIMRFFST